MPRRRASSQRGMMALFVTILLVLSGIYFALTGQSVNVVIGATATPSSILPSTLPPSTPFELTPSPQVTWWQVYFTDPLTVNDPNNYSASIEQKLIDHINAARTSIHIASFEFDLTPVAEALIAAHNRGVDVRWVTDDEYGLEADLEPGHGQFKMLQDTGIEIRSDSRTALMHNKFWIFDQQILWTGSTNITKNGIFIQNNNTIVFTAPELATIYEREFQEMWDGKFGPRSPSQLNEQSLTLNGTPIRVIFTSEDPALEPSIVPMVQGANSNIRFLAFSFTDFPLADAMIQRAQQGVSVMGVIDKTQSGGQGSELGTLYCANIPVRQDGNPQFMHSKVIIIDDRYVITGSLNYSTSAEESNDENVIVIDNPDIARLYVQDFERVYNQGTAPDPAKVSCP
jgi:phosphatidylserine/phosphatidylglycerophosphate/cardiolipin synthase-like enzyme